MLYIFMKPALSNDTIEGTLLRIRYHDRENDFVSLDVLTGDENVIRAVGAYPNPVRDEQLTLEGGYTPHAGLGRVFAFTRFRARPPVGMEARIRYLSDLCEISSEHARQFIDRFGDELIGIIETHHDQLMQIDGIDHHAALAIHERYMSQKAQDRLAVLLEQMGVGSSALAKLRQHLGHGQVDEMLRENPYLLTLYAEYSFKEIDQLAEKLNATGHLDRLPAAILALLRHRATHGHTVISLTELCNDIKPVIRKHIVKEEIILQTAIKRLQKAELIVVIDEQLILHSIYHAEVDIMRGLKRIQTGEREYDTGLNLAWLIEKLSPKPHFINPTVLLEAILRNKIITIDINDERIAKECLLIIQQLFKYVQADVVMCCPGRGDAAQLSKWLKIEVYSPSNLLQDTGMGTMTFREDRPLYTDAVIVYRAETMSTLKMADIVRAVPANACLILVGEERLLSPEGPGDPYRTLRHFDNIVTNLTFGIKLDKQASLLDTFKDHLRLGLSPPLPKKLCLGDSLWVFPAEEKNGTQILNVIMNTVLPKFERAKKEETVVFCVGPKGEREKWQLAYQQISQTRETPTLLNGLTVYQNDVLRINKDIPDYDLTEGTMVKLMNVKRGPCAIVQPFGIKETYALDGSQLSHIDHAYFSPVNQIGARVDNVILYGVSPYASHIHIEQLYYAARIAKKRLILIGDVNSLIASTTLPRRHRQCGLFKLLSDEYENQANTVKEHAG